MSTNDEIRRAADDQRPSVSVDGPGRDAMAEIRDVFTRLEAAFAAENAAAFDDVFTEDIVFVTPAGELLRGWDEVNTYHQRLFAGGLSGRIHYEPVAVRFLAGGHAVVNVEQELTTPQLAVTNRGTWVFTWQGDTWCVCSVHNTNVAEPGS